MECSAEEMTVRAGDSSEDIVVTRKDSSNNLYLLNAGYTCQLKVEGTSIDRAVNTLRADNKAFVTSLTVAETTGMAEDGDYRALVTLAHAASGYRRTKVINIKVCC